MNVTVRKYEEKDLPDLIRIWNEVVEDGVAFPQEECLNEETGKAFFSEQTYTAAAVDAESGKVYGLYILHPNNIGRCGKQRFQRTSHWRKAGIRLSDPGKRAWFWCPAV